MIQLYKLHCIGTYFTTSKLKLIKRITCNIIVLNVKNNNNNMCKIYKMYIIVNTNMLIILYFQSKTLID